MTDNQETSTTHESLQKKEGVSAKPRLPAHAHSGHRRRLRDRYRAVGLDGFAPHEVLEFLLTYCIPRHDVNASAHALLDRFDSFSEVLDAPVSELKKVNGIGEEAALYLTLMPDLFRYYALDRCNAKEPMDTVGKIADYLHALYTGLSHEQVNLLLFDNGMRLIDCCRIEDGAVNCSNASVRKIAEAVLFHHASGAVLAHNHPRGIPVPSGADYEVTDVVAAALELFGVPLIEHFIVTDHQCVPIRRGRGSLRSPVGDSHFGENFYRSFYGDMPEE